jgi:hypothetical protein
MTVYANLVDGQVRGVYDLIPKFWDGINNFDVRCQNDEQYMRDNNFVKIVKSQYQYDSDTHYLSDFPSYRVENNQVIEQREILEKVIYVPTRDDLLKEIRIVRDEKMRDFEWRYTRYHRQIRLGLPTTDSLENLDNYMQALADITNQEDLSNIIWPEY